jgi:Short C-terminal domain
VAHTLRVARLFKEDTVGLLFRPRRPLLRLAARAATAGVVYQAGRRRERQEAYNRQAAAAYRAIQEPSPPPRPADAAPGPVAELERLARLYESGALSDVEFAAAKRRALGA